MSIEEDLARRHDEALLAGLPPLLLYISTAAGFAHWLDSGEFVAGAVGVGVPVELEFVGGLLTPGSPPGAPRRDMARPGHSSTAAALRYQHATQERDRAIADRMDGMIRPPKTVLRAIEG